jgi:hypothetical protein
LKTNTSRQPKVSAAIRAGAALCVFVWVTGIVLCNVERFCNCTGHGQSAHAHEAEATQEQSHSHDAEHHHDAEAHEHAAASHHHDDGAAQGDHGCKGKKCGDEKRCCSTIQALVVTPTPIVIAKPVTQPALLISLLSVAREHALTAPACGEFRRARSRDWVFTPEVCLGPALHSLAPPASV